MNKPFELLVFDWDGTLMDSEARILACLRAAARDVGLNVLPDTALRDVIGLGLPEAIATLYPEADAQARRHFGDSYRHHFLGADQTETALFPGALDLLRALNDQGFLLAVATGKGRRGLDRVMIETGCKDLFHGTRCADETFSKPHPRMLLELMDELGASPSRTLMIGDTEYDLAMARNAGTAALAVSYGAHERERLARQEPLACLDSLEEVGAWLRGAAV